MTQWNDSFTESSLTLAAAVRTPRVNNSTAGTPARRSLARLTGYALKTYPKGYTVALVHRVEDACRDATGENSADFVLPTLGLRLATEGAA
jgi:hypothetical protein